MIRGTSAFALEAKIVEVFPERVTCALGQGLGGWEGRELQGVP